MNEFSDKKVNKIMISKLVLDYSYTQIPLL